MEWRVQMHVQYVYRCVCVCVVLDPLFFWVLGAASYLFSIYEFQSYCFFFTNSLIRVVLIRVTGALRCVRAVCARVCAYQRGRVNSELRSAVCPPAVAL